MLIRLLLFLLPGVAAAQMGVLSGGSPSSEPPWVQLIGTDSLVSCNSGGAQPPAPCNQANGYALLNNASASGTAYVFDRAYMLRRVELSTSGANGNDCILSVRIGATSIISSSRHFSAVTRHWVGEIESDRVTISDPTGSRCVVSWVRVWAEGP